MASTETTEKPVDLVEAAERITEARAEASKEGSGLHPVEPAETPAAEGLIPAQQGQPDSSGLIAVEQPENLPIPVSSEPDPSASSHAHTNARASIYKTPSAAAPIPITSTLSDTGPLSPSSSSSLFPSPSSTSPPSYALTRSITTPTSIYPPTTPTPLNHVTSLRASPSIRQLSKPSYGRDVALRVGPIGLLTLPLHIYSTLRGTAQAWDKLLSTLPDVDIAQPSLDIGCARGKVLLKLAERKKRLAGVSHLPIAPAYGVDKFAGHGGHGGGVAAAQTCANARALGVEEQVVLHTARFEDLPFADESFAVVTSSMALHRMGRAERVGAVREVARVCQPGGWVIIMDYSMSALDCEKALKGSGWARVDSEMTGASVVYGLQTCSVLRARKPLKRKSKPMGGYDELDFAIAEDHF